MGIPLAALLAAAAIVAAAFFYGDELVTDRVKIQLLLPPFTGIDDWRPGRTMLPAVGVGVAVVVGFFGFARRARWSHVMWAAGGLALAWAAALALVDGRDALTTPLLSQQYIRTVPFVGDIGTFLSTYVERLPRYNIHTQGHPPGMVVVLWALDSIGLGGTGWNAALVFLGGAGGVVATLVALRDIAGQAAARAAAPFLVLAPGAIWWSSGDAFFAGVGAAAVCAAVVASGRDGSDGDLLATLGGVLFVATAYLSYGLVLLALIPIAIGVSRRAFRPLVIAALVGGGLVALITIVTGFVWWDGLAATRERYVFGVASRRPYDYFLLADLAIFLMVVGPATIVAFTRLRRSPLLVLVGAAVATVLLANVSGMAKGEVERIWLPFFPWVMVATAVFAAQARTARCWLAVQCGATLALAVGLRSPW